MYAIHLFLKTACIGLSLHALMSCGSEHSALSSFEKKQKKQFYINDSVEKFYHYERKIINHAQSQCSFNNPITQHFREHISFKTLKSVHFQPWQTNIFVEFTVDKNSNVNYLSTNSTDKILDYEIKNAFLSFETKFLKNENLDSSRLYHLVVIQNIHNYAVVKCTKSTISYSPPIYGECDYYHNYNNLNHCNHNFITNYLCNHVDLGLITKEDIDQNHSIYPTLIIDNHGGVIAAKVESKNKAFLEAYYHTILNLPKAKYPAEFNYANEFYGYKFPEKITEIIARNADYQSYVMRTKHLHHNEKQCMKSYIDLLRDRRL